jgi:glycosyltransferase involved in cell wall biosynthesis
MKDNKVKTLVILTPGFPENEADSTCIPPQQIFVKALKETHPELNIIILTFQYPFFSAEYDWHGIRVIAFGGENKGRLFRLFRGLRVWKTLGRLNKEHQLIGLLSFWFGKCALIASGFARRHRLTNYCWILGQDAKAGNKYFNLIKPAAESLIALSDFIATEFHKNYGIKPAHLVPVGIETSLFDAANAERDIDIIGAGNLIPLKQYPVFLEIIHSLKTFRPDIKAVICGDGPERKRLEQMIKALRLESNVLLKGRLSHPEVLLLMQRSRLFVHTSNYEGFGAVCLEALYAGAQVVSFVEPMQAAIKNWHIAAGTDEMVNILKTLLQDPTIRYEPVLPFPIQDNVKKIMDLFDHNDAAIL